MTLFKNETQKTITEWCEATFGPLDSNTRLGVRANEEMAELLEAVEQGKHTAAVTEAADVVIVLSRLATVFNVDLSVVLPDRPATVSELAVAANKRMAWLLRCLSRPDGDGAGSAMLSLAGSLLTFALTVGRELGHTVDAKMAVNRSRQWRLDGSGQGYHVPGGEA